MPHQRQIVTCLLILYTDTKDGTLFSGTKMLNSRCATQERKVKRCCGLEGLFPKQKWRVITLGQWTLFVICEQQIILFVGFEWTYKGWSSSFFHNFRWMCSFGGLFISNKHLRSCLTSDGKSFFGLRPQQQPSNPSRLYLSFWLGIKEGVVLPCFTKPDLQETFFRELLDAAAQQADLLDIIILALLHLELIRLGLLIILPWLALPYLGHSCLCSDLQ